MAPWTAACQASLFITNSWSLLKHMTIQLMMPPNHLILCHPLLLPPSVFPSIRVFSYKSVLPIRWPMDWLDLLTAQATLKSLLQHHTSKASVLRFSAFFIVQLSHLYMITGKAIALTRWTFVGNIQSSTTYNNQDIKAT